MSDKPIPQKPTGHYKSHLQPEPVPISFISAEQLAHHSTSSYNSIFSSPRIPTHHQYRLIMNPEHNMNTNYQNLSVSVMATNNTVSATAAAAAVQFENFDKKILKPLPPQPVDLSIFKGFKFVTLDALQIETRDIYDEISRTVNWEMCENDDERCIQCIQDDCKNKRVFLIASGSLGEQVVPKIHELPQLYAIYIYCVNLTRHQEWAKKYSKVRVVCDNDDVDLLPQFAVDVAQANIDWADALIKQGKYDDAKKKLTLAAAKLSYYVRNYDKSMDKDIKNKLDKCK